jgi:Protein of unknown function (DUF3800)
VYLDESGKLSGKSNFTCLAGYVGHATEWERFGIEWTNLRFKWQVPPIHMARIMSPDSKQDEWAKKKQECGALWEEKRDVMISEFATAILNANLIAVGVGVYADVYREVRADPECRLIGDDTNVFSFHETLLRAISRVETVDKHSPISIVLDNDPDTAMNYYDYYQMLKNHPDQGMQGVRDSVRHRVRGICFCDDESYPGLQAADMIAYVSRRELIERDRDSSREGSTLFAQLTHGGMYQPKIYTPEILRKMGRNIAVRLRENNVKVNGRATEGPLSEQSQVE